MVIVCLDRLLVILVQVLEVGQNSLRVLPCEISGFFGYLVVKASVDNARVFRLLDNIFGLNCSLMSDFIVRHDTVLNQPILHFRLEHLLPACLRVRKHIPRPFIHIIQILILLMGFLLKLAFNLALSLFLHGSIKVKALLKVIESGRCLDL